jgi:hypothetical protein
MLLDTPPRFSPAGSPVDQLYATLPALTAPDGSPILPGFLLWAFSLNEGDLLALSAESAPAGSWRFLSYGERALRAADSCLNPWPHIEELLRLPMAAVGPNGVLRLPEEAEALRAGPVLLRVEVDPHWQSFTLEPANGWPIALERHLKAHYLLPVLPGFRVMLPEDLLWVFDLGPGDQLACKTSLAMAEFEPLELKKKPPEGRRPVALGPGGLLTLPDSLRVASTLKPNAQVRLEVTFSNRVTFQVRPWAQ